MRYNFEFLRDKIYDSKDLGMSDRLSSNKNHELYTASWSRFLERKFVG